MKGSDPTISVVIATHNRPHLLPRAVESVLAQTMHDFEIIVVDDGIQERAGEVVSSYRDSRILYIQHEENSGCSAAKNTGVRHARGAYIAFLDDDDWWVPEKLALQYSALKDTADDVGFSFTAVLNVHEDRYERTHVPEGVADYHDRALSVLNGFLSGTLMTKRFVFDDVGFLDESFPSHTDIEWIIRATRVYRGVGINKALLRMDFTEHEHIGGDPLRRARGREKLLAKYEDAFQENPDILAKHTFRLATFYRKAGRYRQARGALYRSWKARRRLRTLLHYFSMFSGGLPYRVVRPVVDAFRS